jgi:hypothetical protein
MGAHDSILATCTDTALALPADFDAAAYDTSLALDKLIAAGGAPVDGTPMQVLGDHKLALFHNLRHGLEAPSFLGSWPAGWYIPTEADWRAHWIRQPPPENRYALAWAPPSAGGSTSASRETGQLFCHQSIRTDQRYVQAEAGVGVLVTPTRTLSVVSLQPQVDCRTVQSWRALFNRPVAGATHVRTSLILAAWQNIPGPNAWDLLGWKQHVVSDLGANSGQGYTAPLSGTQSFNGNALATPFVVQAGRTYLLGVVARVSITSALTDDRGAPLPPIADGSFSVWGSLAAQVRRIEVVEQQVHIP